MPFTKTPRPYHKEWLQQKARDEKAPRAARARARYDLEKDGQVSPDLVIDHKTPLSKGGTNAPGNKRVVARKTNASFSRNADHSVKVNKPRGQR